MKRLLGIATLTTGLVACGGSGEGDDEANGIAERVEIVVPANEPFEHQLEGAPCGETGVQASGAPPPGVTWSEPNGLCEFTLYGELAPGEYVFELTFGIVNDGPTQKELWEITLIAE